MVEAMAAQPVNEIQTARGSHSRTCSKNCAPSISAMRMSEITRSTLSVTVTVSASGAAALCANNIRQPLGRNKRRNPLRMEGSSSTQSTTACDSLRVLN